MKVLPCSEQRSIKIKQQKSIFADHLVLNYLDCINFVDEFKRKNTMNMKWVRDVCINLRDTAFNQLIHLNENADSNYQLEGGIADKNQIDFIRDDINQKWNHPFISIKRF